MFSAASVCQFVCLFVNMITGERLGLNVGWWNVTVTCILQKSRPSSNVKVKGQGHRGQKTRKCGISFASHRLGRGPRVAFCREPSSKALLRRWENQRTLSSSYIYCLLSFLQCVSAFYIYAVQLYSYFHSLHSLTWTYHTTCFLVKVKIGR